MKPGLQVQLHQQLALTPQLQQAIRLLQLSNLELGTELRQLADANPMLMLDGLDEEDPGVGEDADSEQSAATAEVEPDYTEPDYSDRADTPLEFDVGFKRAASGASSEGMEESVAAETLREHLLWQVNLGATRASEQAVFIALIDAIDDDGYLREGNADIAAALAPEYVVEDAEIEVVRQRLLRFDPVAIGSRDLRECLTVQLALTAADSADLELAARIVDTELDLLARGDNERLCRRMRVTAEALQQACALIRGLEPRPGSSFDSTPIEYVTPDAYAQRVNGRWQVTLSPDCRPRLEINQHYCGLMAEARGDDASYLRGQLQEARWLLKSLESRADTIHKVANAIVRAQSAFLDYGPEAMRPLVLREVAELVEMHESTISRVTTRKYLHTPRGIFEFKHFFSSGVGTEDGGSASATAIQAMIRKLIDAEDRRKPLSDEALSRELKQRGIQVARRTVAKYRELLRIPASSDRVHFGSTQAQGNSIA